MRKWLVAGALAAVLGGTTGVVIAATDTPDDVWGGHNMKYGGPIDLSTAPEVVGVADSTGKIIGYAPNPALYDWPQAPLDEWLADRPEDVKLPQQGG
jgi:hypothetical protein